MNYLIITFDGFGDGVIYYPFFKYIGEKIPKSIFFYSSNKFFSDNLISKKLKIPYNFKIIKNEYIRRFFPEYWEKISDFIKDNNIHSVINLRTSGIKLERDYYNFKNWFISTNNEVNFYDVEMLRNNKKIDKNIRDVISDILKRGINKNIIYNRPSLETLFPKNKKSEHILINMHAGGVFKLWEYLKWTKLISLVVSLGKPIKIYEGFYDSEKNYTKKVISKLPQTIKDKLRIYMN